MIDDDDDDDQLDLPFTKPGRVPNPPRPADFRRHLRKNPHLWAAFESRALRATRRKDHWGSRGIFEIVRWETGEEAHGEGFKINNVWTAFYARHFEKLHPEHRGFFRKRHSPNADAEDEEG